MIGFDIGGTKCAVSVGNICEGGLKIAEKKVFSQDTSEKPEMIIDRMCALAESMTDDFSRIGISCGGPLDSKRGVICSPPNLPGWDDVHIVDILKKRYGGRVLLQNDANACAVAEWKYGAGKNCENMVFLTFGTGMGAGIIANGKLIDGACGMAGEVGHIRLEKSGPLGYGKSGSFEGFCSGGGLLRQTGITARELAEKARLGDKNALSIFKNCGEKLGYALAILIDVLNPEKIVIGSIYSRCEELLRDSMMQELQKEALSLSLSKCSILPSLLGEQIGDYAALAVASMIGE